MRILQLITRRQFRGAEVFAKNLSNSLTKIGHEVSLVGILPPKEENFGEELHPTDLLLENQSISYRSLKKLADHINNKNIEIVQANASITLKFSVFSKMLFRWQAPIVYRNASITTLWIRNSLHKQINRWLLNKVDAIACISEKSMQDLSNGLNIKQDKLHLLPNGIEEMPAKANHLTNNRILHIGSFTSEKNHYGLLRIFKETGLDFELWLAGDGPLREDVVSYALRLGIEEKVHFLGIVEDVSALLAQVDLLVLPSLIEGQPGVVLEAGMMGVPVVSYDVGSLSDIIPEEYSDFIVRTGEEVDFAERVYQLATRKDLANAYGGALRSKVLESFSLKKVSMGFEGLYRSLISSN